ncbi:MAG TPA: hypothetical protein VD706_02820, partial [Candidatus Saccharimonadales bacterium]|nr:hypothetical protein [Candidatus Saccharimonadales bacterium]
MPKLPEIETALDRGLAFLGKSQEDDGGFVSYSSISKQSFRRLKSTRTTFVPALMLASLAALEQPAASRIRDRIAGFLLRQKDDTWAFNYWAKEAPERMAMPYPNDLDDTFCALSALYLHDSSIIDEAALAKIIKLLLATETKVGGPYRTWLVPPDSETVWLDVDTAVNSNVAYFLSLASNSLPALDDMMGAAIAKDAFVSPYYPSEYALIYYFARAYGGPGKPRLWRKAGELQEKAGTDLERALCLTARMRLDDRQDVSAAVTGLLKTRRRDGSWPAAAFCHDPETNGKPCYNGAAVLTTAFVLEALGLYRDRYDVSRQPRNKANKASAPVPHATVLRLAGRRSRTLPAELRRTMMRALTRLAESDNGGEILSLPERFSGSLVKPVRPMPEQFLEKLGLANLYGWLAYTIYDDFLDEEGQPGLLPAANVAMRESLQGFLEALPANKAFHQETREVFNTIDGANAWELDHCRYRIRDNDITVGSLPVYGDLMKLAERSLGH